MLKAMIDKAAWGALSAEVQALYTERDGNYHLAVEGMVSDAEVAGLKSNTAKALEEKKKAQAELAELLAKVGDPEKAAEALKKLQDMEDKDLSDKGKWDELFEKRTERMRADHDSQVKKLIEELDSAKGTIQTLTGKLSEKVVESGVLEALTAQKIPITKAVRNLALSEARSMFTINDKGDPEARDKDGALRFGKDAKSPFGFGDFAAEFIASYADELWNDQGGGASNGGPKLGNKENWNKMSPTERLNAARAEGQAH